MMIDVSVRLRRAIHLNDFVLVKRIVKNNPGKLRNPDFTDQGNTTLHLAAKLGRLELAEFFIDVGHEDDGISRNANGDTPLMLGVGADDRVAQLLAERFPRCIEWKNKQGADAVCFHLLSCPRLADPIKAYSPSLSASDNDGNTALHYASANGHLKCIRTLLEAGANPHARNTYSWTPVSYSSTVAAEVYFRNLVGDLERRRLEEREVKRGVEMGVRVVGREEEEEDEVGPRAYVGLRNRAGSAE
ncbi:MAG: hypothetical protein Q9187_001371 [Circinaria calcarea]